MGALTDRSSSLERQPILHYVETENCEPSAVAFRGAQPADRGLRLAEVMSRFEYRKGGADRVLDVFFLLQQLLLVVVVR